MDKWQSIKCLCQLHNSHRCNFKSISWTLRPHICIDTDTFLTPGLVYLLEQDILAYNCEDPASSSLPFPIIADCKRELAVALGMLDPDEKDKDGMPLTARCVSLHNKNLILLFRGLNILSTLMTTESDYFPSQTPRLCVCSGVYHRPRQKAQTVAPLPGHHRTQLWRDLASGGLPPAHSRETSGHACRLEGTSHAGGGHPAQRRERIQLPRRITLFSFSARRVCDGPSQHVRGGGRRSVPSWRLHQRAALWEEVPALHAQAMSTGRDGTDIQYSLDLLNI